MKSLLQRFPDLPIALLLFGVTAALFWPATWWIAQQTVAHEQLRQSFFLLLFAAVILWIDHRKSLHLSVQVSRRAVTLLAVAFVLMGTALFYPLPLVPLVALAVALAAFTHIAFGDGGFRTTLPWVAGFGGFLVFVVLFQLADWPLRTLAGSQAAQLLALFGNEVELRGILQPSGMLLLTVNRRMYEVATECNGFGLMSTAAILALLLVFSRPLPVGWKCVAVVLALAVGFAFNILRILGIVALAPYFPAHYDFIHEVIGLAALFGGLGFVWWLLGGPKKVTPSAGCPPETAPPPALAPTGNSAG